MNHSPYPRLAAMTLLSFGAVLVLMYSMANVLANVYPNLNQLYMAGLMTAPMVLFEMFLMGVMYQNKKPNFAIIAVALIVFVGFFLAIRYQVGISDEEFVKSMIPHHPGAVLMCEKADLNDPEIHALCAGIISGQQQEIEQMKKILERI